MKKIDRKMHRDMQGSIQLSCAFLVQTHFTGFKWNKKLANKHDNTTGCKCAEMQKFNKVFMQIYLTATELKTKLYF